MPKDASATGSPSATNRRSSSETNVAQLGVGAATKTALAHAQGASTRSCLVRDRISFEIAGAESTPLSTVGDGCPDVENESVAYCNQRGTRMTTIIASLESVSLEEALHYLDSAEGDELVAAYSLAKDRNLLDGSDKEPDDAEVHHALFLLRRARGLNAPSFDLMRVQLRRLVAA